jgi:transposase
MDVHKDSIDVTLAEAGGELRRFGSIGGERASLLKLVRKLTSQGKQLVFVYEAGPCGFWIYREITALGHACMVVSPSLIPRRSGDHVKTDRRDSERLASLARAGELEPIHVPDIRDEAIRDLVCQGEPKFPQMWESKIPHPVHTSASSERTRPAFNFSLRRYELPRMLRVTA